MTPEQLRRWMLRHEYNVSALSRELRVARSTVQRWRSGEAGMPYFADLALETLKRRAQDQSTDGDQDRRLGRRSQPRIGG